MTHKSIPAEKRKATGVSDSLIRLSIGLEEEEDLINDLAATFETIALQTKRNSVEVNA
jgi:cystathionine beta-lyase